MDNERIPTRILARLRALEEIAYCAADLIDSHDEVIGETCKACGQGGDATHGEVLEKLLDEFFKR